MRDYEGDIYFLNFKGQIYSQSNVTTATNPGFSLVQPARNFRPLQQVGELTNFF